MIKTVFVILRAYKSIPRDPAKWKTDKDIQRQRYVAWCPQVQNSGFKAPLLRKAASLELPHPDPDPDHQYSLSVNLLAEEKFTWHSS